MSKVVVEKELGSTPTITESEVVDILVQNGIVKKHVLFLKPSRISGSKTPDIQIDYAAKWEIKSITKDSKYTLEPARHLYAPDGPFVISYGKATDGLTQL